MRLAKSLTYWLRTPQGWRAAAYKRMGRPEGEVSLALMPPSLPAQRLAPNDDSSVVAGHRRTLIAAEQAFSDEAQRIGIGPAFRRNGRDDAVNGGGEAGFTIGAEAISRAVGDGSATSPVSWGADDAGRLERRSRNHLRRDQAQWSAPRRAARRLRLLHHLAAGIP